MRIYIKSLYFILISFLLKFDLFNSFLFNKFELSRFNIFKNSIKTVSSEVKNKKLTNNFIVNKINNSSFNEFKQLVFNITSPFFEDNKKLITITPGGLKGFYVLGICSYLKENYDLSNYVFSGASAGSWNSLFLSYKYDTKKIIDTIFDIDFKNAGSIFNIELMIKEKFLSEFDDNDFDLEKVYIGSTIFEKYRLKSIVYNDFDSLADAIDCCIGSSHIPFVCGSLYFIYKEKITVDGGISLYINESPYLPTKIPSLIINPNLFKKSISNNEIVDLCDYYKGYFDSIDINKVSNVKQMFDEGYNNAKDNKEALDDIFLN